MKNARFALMALLATTLLAGQGCFPKQTAAPAINNPARQPSQEVATGIWRTVLNGAERAQYTSSTLQATVIMYRFEPKFFTFKFEAASTTRSMTDWYRLNQRANLIINGVYFHDDNLPSGYLSAMGVRLGNRQFDLDKSGLIDLADQTQIIDTSTGTITLTDYANAAQSYPFFFKDGVPAIKEDSQKPARRSFFGKDKTGHVYFGVIADSQISLFQTMEMLGETGVDWQNVINLDGGPSTGLIANVDSSEAIPSLFPIPNVIVVTHR